jgi:hypothetical protein
MVVLKLIIVQRNQNENQIENQIETDSTAVC